MSKHDDNYDKIYLVIYIYFIRSNIQQKQCISRLQWRVSRTRRSRTSTNGGHNTMEHKTSKIVAQKVGLVKIKDKNTHAHNRLIIITQTIWLLIDYRCRLPDKP